MANETPKKILTSPSDGGDYGILSAEIKQPLYGNPDTIVWARNMASQDGHFFPYVLNGSNSYIGTSHYPEMVDRNPTLLNDIRNWVLNGTIRTAPTKTGPKANVDSMLDWTRNILEKYKAKKEDEGSQTM